MTYTARETSTYLGAPYELYKFTTLDNAWYLTSADEPKIYLANTYTPTPILHTPSQQSAELKSGAIKITIPHDHAIAQQFISYIPNTPMFLTIYRAHDGDPDGETVVHWIGKITLASFDDDCELNGAPEQEALKKRVPFMKYQRQCNRILFAPGCDVDKTLFRVTPTIATVSTDGLTITATVFGTKPDGWFNNGYLEKGNQRRMIVGHVGTSIVLIAAMPGLAVADTPFAYAGCDRQYNGDCVGKFNNGPNFFGFPFIPTKNPFNGIK
jgi:uncharacterized phage protein (TIGR02218 family)